MRGRKPKPSALKVIEGKRGPGEKEPQPEKPARVLRCPNHLSPGAKKEWNRMAKPLHELGLLSRIDRAAFEGYCESYATWVEATTLLHKSGILLKGKESGLLYQNPCLSVANQALRQMKAFLSEFGMTPASRTRIQVEPPKDSTDLLGAIFGDLKL